MNERIKGGVLSLAFLVVTLSVYLILWQLSVLYFDLPVYYYARLIELLATLLFLSLVIATPMKFEQMGILTSKGTLFRSLALGGGIALLAVLSFALLGLVKGTDPLFSWHVTGDISRVTYFAVAPFQEILSKSVMFYSFELAFDMKHPHYANLLAALVFGAFHVVYGIKMMLLAMLLSLLTGLLFMRERCVWGCALTHFAFGFFPLCFGIG